MNKKLSLVLFLIFLTLSTDPLGAVTITFDVKDTYIEVGETFEVDIFAQEDVSKGDMWLFGFDVDPLTTLSLFSLNDYNVGSIFLDEGDGSHYVAGSILDPFEPNAGDNLHLATLSFSAGGIDGTQTLSAFGDPLDPSFDRGAYYYNLTTDEAFDLMISEEIDITIHKATVPEPTTLLLFGMGILGLSRIGRSKRTN